MVPCFVICFPPALLLTKRAPEIDMQKVRAVDAEPSVRTGIYSIFTRGLQEIGPVGRATPHSEAC
jgi:hypothetical protein